MSDSAPTLLAEHKGLVVDIATRIKQRFRLRIELDELVAAGLEGLVQAERTYDAKKGYAFSTFAYYRVRGAIMDNCRNLGALRRDYRQRAHFEEAANEVLASAAEEAPAEPDAGANSRWIGSTIDTLAAAYQLSRSGTRDRQRQRTNPEARIREAQLGERLRSELDKLSDEEREVIRRYYFEHEPLTSIAKEYGVSKSWVSRVHTRALGQLRRALKPED